MMQVPPCFQVGLVYRARQSSLKDNTTRVFRRMMGMKNPRRSQRRIQNCTKCGELGHTVRQNSLDAAIVNREQKNVSGLKALSLNVMLCSYCDYYTLFVKQRSTMQMNSTYPVLFEDSKSNISFLQLILKTFNSKGFVILIGMKKLPLKEVFWCMEILNLSSLFWLLVFMFQLY